MSDQKTKEQNNDNQNKLQSWLMPRNLSLIQEEDEANEKDKTV